jgi:hypothetical protein
MRIASPVCNGSCASAISLEASLFVLSTVTISSQHDMTDKAGRHDGLGGKTDDNKNEEENETRRRNAMRGRNEMSR